MDFATRTRIVGVFLRASSGSSSRQWSVRGKRSGMRGASNEMGRISATTRWARRRAAHLVELHEQDDAGPAGVVQGQQEDAQQPRRAIDHGKGHCHQTPLLMAWQAMCRPVWEQKRLISQ